MGRSTKAEDFAALARKRRADAAGKFLHAAVFRFGAGVLQGRSAVDAAGQKTAIDRNYLAGDEGGRLRSQEYGRPGDLVWIAVPMHGGTHEQFLAALGSHHDGER